MRKIKICVAIMILTLSFSICYAAELNFTDVKTDDWFYKNLQELIEKNITSGYPDGTFKPSNTLKFEEFIKMLVVAVSDETIEQKEGQEWYQVYIDEVMEGKYITEQQKSLIGQNISRRTVAEILYNVLAEKEDIVAYTDSELEYLASRMTDLNKADLKTLTINGIGVISGYPDGTFKPNGTLTRAEAVAVISRIINPELRNPVEIVLPDTRTLDELPPVDLSHLYDYPTLTGQTVKEENETYYKYGVDLMETIVNDSIEYMELAHNRDYTTISNKAEKYKSDLLYYLNGYKEYKGIEHYGLRSYSLSLTNDPARIDYLNNRNDFIDDFLNKWVKDTVDNKVKVQAKLYTNKDLLIYADGSNTVRGVLRFKYESHNDPNNIKEELDLVKREAQAKGQRFLNLDKSKYNIYMNFDNIPKLEVGKWYEMDVDIVLFHTSTAKGLTERSLRSYRYIYPIDIREIK